MLTAGPSPPTFRARAVPWNAAARGELASHKRRRAASVATTEADVTENQGPYRRWLDQAWQSMGKHLRDEARELRLIEKAEYLYKSKKKGQIYYSCTNRS